jgi:Skp family chaperone for outer membrane proteins
MKLFASLLAAASISTAAVLAVPASAQVQGNIATVNLPAAVINSSAFTDAYQRILETYKPQFDTIQARQQEIQTLLQPIDTNGDNNVDDAELQAAQGTAGFQRLQAIEQEVAQLNNQIEGARIYSVEQILLQYRPSLEQVTQQLNVQLVLTPESVIYAPPQVNITQQVTAALNTNVPSVAIVPPQNWRPSRNVLAVYEQIAQVLAVLQAQQQAAAQAAQQQSTTQTPAGR